MKIEVVTMFYNDEFIVPFFMNHYSFADHIRAIIDVDTTDNTQEIVSKYPNATIEYFKFQDGFDSNIAATKFNQCYAESEADWVIVVDSDEFIFDLPLTHDVDIFLVRFFQVYRNVNDSDLDPSIPVKLQRRCGDSNAVGGQNKNGTKPVVVRTGKKIRWLPGQHKIWNRHKYITSNTVLTGAHWIMADPSFCVERRLRGKTRHSKYSAMRGHNIHFNVTEEQVRAELERHRNDTKLF